MTQEQILDRIRKLLALASSDNEHEAALAASRAQALLEKHNMEQADIGEVGEPEPIEERVVFEAKGYATWRGRLAANVSTHFGCSCWRQGGRQVFVGRRTDIDAAQVLYLRLIVIVDELTRRDAFGNGRAYVNAFRHGVVTTIGNEMEAQRERTRAEMQGHVSETALVIVNTRTREADEWRDSHHTLTSGTRARVSSGAGLRDGSAAGAGAYGRASTERIGGSGKRLGSGG